MKAKSDEIRQRIAEIEMDLVVLRMELDWILNPRVLFTKGGNQ